MLILNYGVLRMNRQSFLEKMVESNKGNQFSSYALFEELIADTSIDADIMYLGASKNLKCKIHDCCESIGLEAINVDLDKVNGYLDWSDYNPFIMFGENDLPNRYFGYISFNDVYEMISDQLEAEEEYVKVYRIENVDGRGLYISAFASLYEELIDILVDYHAKNKDFSEAKKIFDLKTDNHNVREHYLNRLLIIYKNLKIEIPMGYDFLLNDNTSVRKPYEDGMLTALFDKSIGHADLDLWNFAFESKESLFSWIKEAGIQSLSKKMDLKMVNLRVPVSSFIKSDNQVAYLKGSAIKILDGKLIF
jgi:hypothetical protein